MKKVIHPILVVFLACLCFASNCKKPTKEQKYLGTYPLGDIKDYLYFKPGSMWVYECDSTGELDTQFMMSIDTPWTIKSYIKYQSILFTVKSINEGSTYANGHPPGDIYYNEKYTYYFGLDRKKTNPKYPDGATDHVFFKPFDTNLYPKGQYSQTYIGLVPILNVLGKNYDSVRIFQVQAGGSFPYCKIKTWNVGTLTFYWAKNVGLVRLFVETAKDGTQTAFNFNWNLKEYHLIS